MSFVTSLVATATETKKVSMADALPHLTGFLVVLVTLAVLLALCSIVSKIIQATTKEQVTPQPASIPTPTATASTNDDSISPEIIAVIAAAVNATVGRKQRIVTIKPRNSSWGQSGRQAHHTSHNLR